MWIPKDLVVLVWGSVHDIEVRDVLRCQWGMFMLMRW